MKEKGKGFHKKVLLDFYEVKVKNDTVKKKRLWKKIIVGIVKTKQRQHTFHYLTVYARKGIKENIKRLHEVDDNNNIIRICLDREVIEEIIIEHNIQYFQ